MQGSKTSRVACPIWKRNGDSQGSRMQRSALRALRVPKETCTSRRQGATGNGFPGCRSFTQSGSQAAQDLDLCCQEANFVHLRQRQTNSSVGAHTWAPNSLSLAATSPLPWQVSPCAAHRSPSLITMNSLIQASCASPVSTILKLDQILEDPCGHGPTPYPSRTWA